MGRVSVGGNTAGDNTFNVTSLLTAQPQPIQQSVDYIASLERLLSNPALKPLIDNASNLIGQYSNKMALDNQERLLKQQKQTAQQNSGAPMHRVVFGHGSDAE